MRRLRKVTIEGFKSISSAELVLSDINVVIGANGSGKSNLIGVFKLLENILDGRLQHYVGVQGGADRLLHYGRKTTPECRLVFESDGFSYALTLEPNARNRFVVAHEKLELQGDVSSSFSLGSDETDLLGLEADLLLGELALSSTEVLDLSINKLPDLSVDNFQDLPSVYLKSFKSYHFHDTSDAAPSRQDAKIRDARTLDSEGRNLPAYLYLLKHKHAESYRHIVEHIRLVAPFFDDFVLEPSPDNEQMIRLEWRHKYSDTYFDAQSFSDGTLRFVCLATVLLQPNPPALILLDEPELGLHPLAIRILAEMLDAAAEKTQVLIATQSVTLLDHFSLDRVIVADYDGLKTHFNRPQEEEMKAWLESFSVGELWQKNVIGGRP